MRSRKFAEARARSVVNESDVQLAIQAKSNLAFLPPSGSLKNTKDPKFQINELPLPKIDPDAVAKQRIVSRRSVYAVERSGNTEEIDVKAVTDVGSAVESSALDDATSKSSTFAPQKEQTKIKIKLAENTGPESMDVES